MDANNRLLELRKILMYYFSQSFDKKWPERAIDVLGKKIVEDSSLLPKVEILINETIHDYQKGKVKNVAAAIRGSFDKIYGINVDLEKK